MEQLRGTAEQWVRIGFYVYRGEIVRVAQHDYVAFRTIVRGSGRKHDPKRKLSPAVYELPVRSVPAEVADADGSARWYRENVEYRGGEFYLDGKPLHRFARPHHTRRQLVPPTPTPPIPERVG